MKNTLYTLLALGASCAVSNAVVTISGTALKSCYGSSPTALVGAGMLGLLVVDDASDGFLGATLSGTPLAGQDPGITGLNASTALNGRFGGDLVVARIATVGPTTSNMTVGTFANINTSAYEGKNFAIIWFEGIASTFTGNMSDNAKYGIARAANWVMPTNSPTTSKVFGTGLSQIQLNNPATISAGGGSVSFATYGTVFKIVPEPSAALLGAFGILTLLRRRRI